MRHSIKTGFSFGLTSGIITTLGLMVGLSSSSNSKGIVIGGILMIAVADSLSDALGIHISEESENKHSAKEIWESTIATFISKLIFASLFVIPVLLFTLPTAVIVSIAWGLFLLVILSIAIAKQQSIKIWGVAAEHLGVAIIVIILTNLIGTRISAIFN